MRLSQRMRRACGINTERQKRVLRMYLARDSYVTDITSQQVDNSLFRLGLIERIGEGCRITVEGRKALKRYDAALCNPLRGLISYQLGG